MNRRTRQAVARRPSGCPRWLRTFTLVRGIDADELRQTFVAGLVYFALRSSCHLIAEGVESEDEATAVRRLGVEFAQAYLFGRPEPIAG
jgi:EAL domain-containing protein (putative c-di-GMP-specific phosphodiesterase class I)